MRDALKLCFSFLVMGSLAGILGAGLSHSFHFLAPLGELLSPSTGIWRHISVDRKGAADALYKALDENGISGVELRYDSNNLPHLKAPDDESLYFAQGFLTAYFRLWQMDFLSRITAGRVSELVGDKALPIDRFFRRLKLPQAAEASTDLLLGDTLTRTAALSYVKGVNSWIAQVDLSTLPIEYRLFGLFPEPWTPDRISYLAKFMAWELSGNFTDYYFEKSKEVLVPVVLDVLFPAIQNFPATILGSSDKTESRNLKNEALADSRESARESARESFMRNSSDHYKSLATRFFPLEAEPHRANGSNSWAIAGDLAVRNKPILANDMHLGYSAPALWFPIGLKSASQNVFGASLPGAPGVLVGFNENLSWGATNGTVDVIDWYRLHFQDTFEKRYQFNDGWRPVIETESKIYLPDKSYEIIKVRETHFGPIVYKEGEAKNIAETPPGTAVQWTGLLPSNELKTFLLLNHARSSSACITFLEEYVSPPQNFLCADQSGQITYRLSGKIPVRKNDGRGITEALSDYDLWQGYIEPSLMPEKLSISDFIVTANQAQVNGSRQSALGWYFADPFRAMRINELLKKEISARKIKPQDFISLQGDQKNLLTDDFVKWALAKLKNAGPEGGLKDVEAQCFSEIQLNEWDGVTDQSSRAATFAAKWFQDFEMLFWSSIYQLNASAGVHEDRELSVRGPKGFFLSGKWQVMEIAKNPDSFSKLGLSLSLEDLISDSAKSACRSLLKRFREVPVWSDYQKTVFPHVGRIPGFGINTIKAGGSAESVYANRGQHGPSFKMIVSMESKPQAWFMFPGGISGDPTAVDYEGFLKAWAQTEMLKVDFDVWGDQKNK